MDTGSHPGRGPVVCTRACIRADGLLLLLLLRRLVRQDERVPANDKWHKSELVGKSAVLAKETMARRTLWGIVFVLEEVNGVLEAQCPVGMVHDFAMLRLATLLAMATPRNFNLPEESRWSVE